MVSKAAQAAAAQHAAGAVARQTAAWDAAAARLASVAAVASQKIAGAGAGSQLFAPGQRDAIPRFSVSELELGRVLGRGGFGTVSEVLKCHCRDNGGGSGDGHVDDETREQLQRDKQFIADQCIREGGDSRYCIKTLSPDVIADEHLFGVGVADMAVETMFLAAVSHPHIIKMRAFGAEGMLAPHYFIMLDRLYDTLEARILKWRQQRLRARGVLNKIKGKSNKKLAALTAIKLSYAYDLMGAFQYLHNSRVVYRDLKPENVGFNVRDDIVLFDFGLSREIRETDEKVTDDTWKLTGETGSLRYMAPEVASNKPYGHSADIYSFGIMLWEMLSAEQPFRGFSKQRHADLVVAQGARPKLDPAWGPALKGFLASSWHADPGRRPAAVKASNVLKREAEKAKGGGGAELDSFRRKSTFVNRNALRERRISAPGRMIDGNRADKLQQTSFRKVNA